MSGAQRVVITGMAINTPLGDRLDAFYENLMAGRSAVRRWACVDPEGIYSKVGGDLSGYDAIAKLESFEDRVPEDVYRRMRKLVRKAPFSTQLSILAAVEAWLDAGLMGEADPERTAVVVAGHNLNKAYLHANEEQFRDEPDYIDPLAALLSLDTDHAGSITEVLGLRGCIYTTGGACASGNLALRHAVDEIRHHGYHNVIVVGALLEFAPMDLHAMALMGAISFQSFNDEPERASRPYDVAREGFVPAHGTGVLILERLDRARARGARPYAEVMHVTAMSDGSHLPQPSEEGQTATMQRLFANGEIAPEEVDFVSAHATSTPLGDISELRAIRNVFGPHAERLKINAPKSMLGHTCWSAPTVETIAAILQMQKGRLHGSINIDELDPEVDLDVCADGPVDHEVRTILKNSFGFGGINCCTLLRRVD